jgi:cytochrome b
MSAVWESQPSIDAPAGARPRVRVWDGFTRLAHWLLVVLMGASWWTARHHHMDYHRYSGYALLGVLIFRLYWGFFGSTTARFAHFVKGPRSIWRYLRSKGTHVAPGHNPLGALSVLALLGLLLAQIALGLFSVDVDGIESGPLSRWVSFEMGRECSLLHQLGFVVLNAFIVVHIGAVMFYWIFKRDNLIRPMITGSKSWRHGALPHVEFASAWRALFGIALAAVLVWYVA